MGGSLKLQISALNTNMNPKYELQHRSGFHKGIYCRYLGGLKKRNKGAKRKVNSGKYFSVHNNEQKKRLLACIMLVLKEILSERVIVCFNLFKRGLLKNYGKT